MTFRESVISLKKVFYHEAAVRRDQRRLISPSAIFNACGAVSIILEATEINGMKLKGTLYKGK